MLPAWRGSERAGRSDRVFLDVPLVVLNMARVVWVDRLPPVSLVIELQPVLLLAVQEGGMYWKDDVEWEKTCGEGVS